MTQENNQELMQRTLLGGLAILLVVGAISLSQVYIFQPFFCLFIASVIAAGLWEFYQMSEALGYQPKTALALIWSFTYVFCVYGSTQSADWSHAPQAVLLLFFFSAFSHFLFTGERPLVNIAVTLFGFAYVTVTLGCMINITYHFPSGGFEDGRYWILYLIAITKVSDMGAYFVGKRFGKNKLAEQLSPGKTVEGAVAGIVAALVVSIIFYLVFNNDASDTPFSLTFGESLRLGLMLGIIGQIGDLSESLLKRDAGVKDSNRLPGLGGALDILDSLLFTTPVLYIFLLVR